MIDRRTRAEIIEGINERKDDVALRAAWLSALRVAAIDEGCDEPSCSCHAHRRAAVDELKALEKRT